MDKRINKVSDKYICPYCFREIYLKDIQFRSNNPEGRCLTDKQFFDYWKSRDIVLDKCSKREAVTPRIRDYGLYKINNSAGKPVPVAYSDEAGSFTEDRVCPNCHNALPPTAGFVNTLNIVVMGPDNAVSYDYTKKLLYSMKFGDLSIPYVKFFIPDVKISQAFSNEESYESLDSDTLPYMTGKVIVPNSKNKTYCECTITYMPFSTSFFADEKSRADKRVLLMDVFSNADAIILATDYSHIIGLNSDKTELKQTLEAYLLHIKQYAEMIASSNMSIPTAVVMNNIELMRKIQETASNIDLGSMNISTDYTYELENDCTRNLISRFNNQLVLYVKSLFIDNKFFSVQEEYKRNNKSAYQNPLHWLLSEFGCLEIIKEKTEKQ